MKAIHKFLLGLVLTLATIWAWEAFDLDGYWIIPAAFVLLAGWALMAWNFGAVIHKFQKKK